MILNFLELINYLVIVLSITMESPSLLKIKVQPQL